LLSDKEGIMGEEERMSDQIIEARGVQKVYDTGGVKVHALKPTFRTRLRRNEEL
jgi:hypothetical protein